MIAHARVRRASHDRLVERCLRDGDDEAWVELWEVFENSSAMEVRRILAEHGVAPEDVDAVVTKCWQQLTGSGSTGSGSFFGGNNAAVASEPSPPKNVPAPLEPREAVKSLGDENAAVATEPSPLMPILGKSLREVKHWFVDRTVLCTLKLVEAGKLLLGEPTNKKANRIKPRSLHFESLEPRQMLAPDLLSFQLYEDTGAADYVTTNPSVTAVVGDVQPCLVQ